MTHIDGVCTAGVAFNLVSQLPVVPKRTQCPLDTFMYSGDLPDCDPTVEVRIHADHCDIATPEHKIFESETGWCTYLDGNTRQIVGPGPQGPDWIAKLHAGFTEADVYCGRVLHANLEGSDVITNPVSWPLDLILTMYVLSSRNGAVIHAAAATLNGKGFLFPGRSEAGKSTISRLLKARGEGVLLSDDRGVVRKMGSDYTLFGTPWPGDARIALNESADLSGIMFLVQAAENEIRPISMTDAFERLMGVTSIPWYDVEVIEPILSFCESLVGEVPVYELRFRRDESVVDMLADFAAP